MDRNYSYLISGCTSASPKESEVHEIPPFDFENGMLKFQNQNI
jgi:hypothetical protein